MAKQTTKTGKELERRVADAYRAMGARKVEHDVELAGHQIDVYVEMETADRALHRIAVEAKDYSKPVGIEIVSGFAAVVTGLRTLKLVDEGVVISAAGYSKQARNAAREHELRLLESSDLDAMVAEANMSTSMLGGSDRRIPHNLPPRSEFIGRAEAKAQIHKALKSRSYLVSIDGIGGIGKTSLVLEIACECLQASKEEASDIAAFEGFIWTTAKDHNLTLNALLDSIALTLEYQEIAQRPLEEKLIAVRRLLQKKPHLLIVDNFETVTDEDLRDFLLELPEPSKALITTREQKLQEVRAISIKGLAEPEALALIRHEGERLSLESLQRAGDPVLLRLYKATGGAPLAIKWAVGQIKRRGQSLDAVLTALHEARGNIFDSVFSRSWSLLSKDAQQVLMVMPLFATSASYAGIEAVSDVHHFALDEALGQLVEMSLLDATDDLEFAQRRYGIHPLTRAFASVQLEKRPEIRQAAQQRSVYFFQRLTEDYGNRHRTEFVHLESDFPNILAVIQWCIEHQQGELAISIFRNITYFMLFYGIDALTMGQEVLKVALDLEDELNAARLQVLPIGWIHRHRGDLDLAEEHITQALATFERLEQEWEIAYAKYHLGRVLQERSALEHAKQLFEEALEFYQSIGDDQRVYRITSYLASVALEGGDLDTAWRLANSVLTPAQHLDRPSTNIRLLKVLGGVAHQRADLEQAVSFYSEALNFSRQASRADRIADILLELAPIEIEMGNMNRARQMLIETSEIYKEFDIQTKSQEVVQLLAKLPVPAEEKP